jgi:hypothetical protein
MTARPALFSVKGTFFWPLRALRTLGSQMWQALMLRTILAGLLRLWVLKKGVVELCVDVVAEGGCCGDGGEEETLNGETEDVIYFPTS